METLSKLYGPFIEPPWIYLILIAVVFLLVLYVIYKYRRVNQGIIPFKTQGGTIEISPHTLRSVIQHATSNVKGVERASCHHFLKGRNIGVRIAIHLQANHRLKDVDASIKRMVRATLLEQFGMENIDPIHIRVTRIIGEPVPTETNRFPDDLDESQAGLLEPDNDSFDDRPYADETRI